MNIKNKVSLSISEAVELLAKIADSLEQKGEFAFDLKGQEVSIEAGDLLNAVLSISPEEFSIVFNWGEQVDAEQEKQKYHETPKMVREVNIPDQPQSSSGPQIPVEEEPYVANVPRRALPDRMPLNTTTLPLDAGYWAPAFTTNEEEQWTLLSIDGELENKKWASDDQITTLSDLTPDSAKPKSKRSRKKKDDDLFSELDNLDKKKPKSKPSSPDTVEEATIPERTSAKPAGKVGTIPKPSSVPSVTNVPQTSSSHSIPSPSPSASNEEWKEPSAEDNATEDNWVKPSKILEKQRSSTPSSSESDSPNDGSQNKRNTIPVPGAKMSSQTSNPSTADEMVNEVREWKEPTQEENVTDDDWVRPSEFLKRSGTDSTPSNPSQEKSDDAANRPPPVAPDKKKKDDDDDKKKGWASWD